MVSLIGAFYYLRIVKLMYFDDPVDGAPIEPRGDTRVLLSANGLAAAAARHPAAAADGAVRRRAGVVRVPLTRAPTPDPGTRQASRPRTGAVSAAVAPAGVGAFRDGNRAMGVLPFSGFPELTMRVGFFVTCLVDLMRPSIGFAAIKLLEAGGAEVFVPPGADLLRPARVQLGRPRRHQGAGARS